MTNSKATKKALFMSMLSLLLCFTMLMGATFAWFTDTVQSTGNKIQAGNLDVQLLMHNGTEYVDISESTTPIFGDESSLIAQNNPADTLWEPGKTQIVYLGVKNNGSLALKYNILLDIVSEATGTGKEALYKALEYAIIADEEYKAGKYSDWNAVKDAAKATGDEYATGGLPIGKGIPTAQNGVLDEIAYDSTKTGETDYFALAIHMKEDAGNEYQDGNVTIDITVFATQKNAEEDSFGPEYDEQAPMGNPVSNSDELKEALENKLDNIVITKDIETNEAYTVEYNVTINGGGNEIKRADGYTGTIFTVASGSTLTLENVVIDGGAVWQNTSTFSMSSSAPTNTGVTATAALVVAENNANIVLEEGTVLQNNDGAHAVNLGTRIGATLTLNGGEIINNRSDSGAVWGGGHITINSGKISYNSSTGSAGAIRMVSNCNLTMNGGEISHNTAAASGGAIWGYGASTYTFNGGEMAYNTAAAGGAMYTGDSSTVNMSGDFEMHDNTADDAGAMRLSNRTAFNMSGGKLYGNTSVNSPSWNGFYGWNPGVNISGGELCDDICIQGGLTPTVGGNGITGVIHFDLSTNHNTANLAADFGTIKFTVAQDDNFAAFNFKPASDYTYTEGDEAKLVCMNEGYSTYWDAATGTFRLQAN
ncbi:MAG: hypothetical protein IJN09_02985 [Oscillospiraceae bacterium]|nr:hypothetical protein [Oscillospiraceae bacterium]